MNLIYDLVRLVANFFYIGAFSFGGGNAMIPFIEEVVIKYNWMNHNEFADMIAISQITPGPIAINMATYVGFTVGGPIGSILATIAVCLPAFILILLITRYILFKFENSFYVDQALKGLRPAVVGLIAVAVFRVARIALINQDAYSQSGQILQSVNYFSVGVTIVSFIAIYKFKIHPIICILIAGGVGAGVYLLT